MQLRREGSNNGEGDRKLSPGEQHRADGLIEGSDLLFSALEARYGADVPDTEKRAAELRQQARARAAVSQALVPLTPDYLRTARQQEFNPNPTSSSAQDILAQNFDPTRTVDFVPIPDMVNMTDTQVPMSSQSNMQDMQGPAAVGSQQ